MKTTDYKGIDYGLGKTNVDKTGIRYGVISQHSLNPDAANDVFQNGRDLSFEQYQKDVKDNLKSALSDYFSDTVWSDGKPSNLAEAVEDCFAKIEDRLYDGYEADSPEMLYEQDGYQIQTCLQSDFIVTASKYYTYAQFCSPCVPGACNLDSTLTEPNEDNKCFCLGHDWFEDSKAPYQVYSVETGEIVNP